MHIPAVHIKPGSLLDFFLKPFLFLTSSEKFGLYHQTEVRKFGLVHKKYLLAFVLIDEYAFEYYNESVTKHHIYSYEYRHNAIVVLMRVIVKLKFTYLSTFGKFSKREGTRLSNLYNTIMELCENKGVKGARMCTETGISKGLLTDLKMGRRSGVSAVTAQKIANYFDVTVGYLLGEEEQKNPTIPEDDGASIDRKELMERIKTLPEEKIQLLLQVAKSIE